MPAWLNIDVFREETRHIVKSKIAHGRHRPRRKDMQDFCDLCDFQSESDKMEATVHIQ